MHKIKRLLAGLMLITLIFSSAACQSNVPPKDPKSTPAVEVSQATVQTAQVSQAPAQKDPVYELGTANQNASGDKQGVYYEIFVRAFADSNGDGIGDLNGLISKLDYLNDGNPETTTDLGITGIWLMPVNKTVSYHGYDVTDYYDINPEYGTMADYEKLLAEAHKRGISVLMDLVLNHTSDKNDWFLQSADPNSPYRDWYRWTIDGSEGYSLNASIWGHNVWNKKGDQYYFGLFWSGMPDLNYDNQKVRDEVKNIAGFWLDKGVDGFRLDAVPHIYDPVEVLPGVNATEKTVAWWQEFKDFCHDRKAGSLVLGEVLNENTAVRTTFLPALDSTFHVGLGTQITNALRTGSSKNNYLCNFIANNYTQYAKANPNYLDAPMLSNHDQNRIIGQLQGNQDQMKVAASIYLTLEGVPFIYYGEEIGMFGSKPDEDIRLPYVWGGDDPVQTRWRQSKYKNVISVSEQAEDPNSLLTHYKRLIRVRNENEALYDGHFEPLTSDNDAIVAYAMKSEHQSAIILHNLNKEPQSITVDTQGYELIFCQTKEGYANQDGKVTLPPLSSVILVK